MVCLSVCLVDCVDVGCDVVVAVAVAVNVAHKGHAAEAEVPEDLTQRLHQLVYGTLEAGRTCSAHLRQQGA